MIPKPSELKELAETARTQRLEAARIEAAKLEIARFEASEQCFRHTLADFPEKAKQAANAGYNQTTMLHLSESNDPRWDAFWKLEAYFKENEYVVEVERRSSTINDSSASLIIKW